MKIIECPRDAMQGINKFIPTELKARYINQLLKVGFDTIDFGSFVSPKAIPQMQDTKDVLKLLELENTNTKLLAIIANERGAIDALAHQQIPYLGFPLSISETFQQRNTNKSIEEALNVVDAIHSLCQEKQKELVVYLSMGFGNPYGDPYDVSFVTNFADVLSTLGIRIISLADTIGIAQPSQISDLFLNLSKSMPHIEFGVHLHATPDTALEKIKAAYDSGCKRFDGALKGFGGCPMAKDELTGNIATETLLGFLADKSDRPLIDASALAHSLAIADEVFAVA